MQAISHSDLKTMNETEHRDFVLINVLPQDSFNQEHIRTSVNVPVDEDNFTSRVEQIAGSKEREVVVYCASFDCDASTRARSEEHTSELQSRGHLVCRLLLENKRLQDR